MEYWCFSKIFAIIDLLYSYVFLAVISFVSFVQYYNIFLGYFTIRMGVAWILFGMNTFLFYRCIVADNHLIRATKMDIDPSRTVDICIVWLKLSRFLIITGFTVIALLSFQQLDNRYSEIEKARINRVLVLLCGFVTQRGMGVYFVNNFKHEMRDSVMSIVEDPVPVAAPLPGYEEICDQNDHYSNSGESLPPSYYDLPPPYSAVVGLSTKTNA